MDRLSPIAIKACAKFKALALIDDGYVQADHNILCPLCGMLFLFLLDPRDQSAHRHMCDEILVIMAFLRVQIAEDHIEGHLLDRFVMLP